MNKFIENLNNVYKSGEFYICENNVVVKVKKVRHYGALLTKKQKEYIMSFCSRVNNKCLKHLTKALAGGVIQLHKEYPNVLIHLEWYN